jgi:hypothetical protein
MTRRCAAIVGALLMLLAGRHGPAEAAPAAEPWPKWETHDDGATAQIDHAAWTYFLQRHVRLGADGIARVDYGAVTSAERAALQTDLARLATLPIDRYSRREQLAYWIDLYNALTVGVVLEHYPVDSIRKIAISPGLFSVGPWSKKLVTVAGEALSLDDIEHRILRPIWRDPRIHYAVNCAALGCPNLQPEAFTAGNAETLLERAAHDYVNHPRGATVADRTLTVSSIYVWYRADFGGTERGVIAHLRHYADPALAAALAPIDRIGADRYDWALNDARE